MLATLSATLLLVTGAALLPAPPPQPAAPSAPAAVYAVAIEALLGVAADREPTYLLPSAAVTDVAMRARRASGPAQLATPSIAREVVALLQRQGRTEVRGVRTRLRSDGTLQLVLGELRFEPATTPSFARLKIAIVGADGQRETLEFLLKREGASWRSLKMEPADNIAAALPGAEAGDVRQRAL